MKKKLLPFFILIFNCLSGFSQNEFVEKWQNTIGGTSQEVVNDVIQTSDGGYLIVGSTLSTNGAFSVNHGDKDYLVVRLDANRNLIWMKLFGGPIDEEAYSVVETHDHFFMIAGYAESSTGDVMSHIGSSDYWLIKIDYNGNIVWEKSYGGSNTDEARKVILTNDGGYFLAGSARSANGDLSSNIGYNDFWGVKLDAAGNIQWQASFGGTQDDLLMDAVQTTDGGYLMTGYSKSSDVHLNINYGYEDYWTVKIDASGILQWQYSSGGTNRDYAKSIIETYDGGIIIAGYSKSNVAGAIVPLHGLSGFSDIWIVKLTSNGNLLWHKYFGGYNTEECYNVFENESHQLVITGGSNSYDGDLTYNQGNFDCWLVHTDEFGNILIQNSFGGSGHDMIRAVKPATDNSLILGTVSSSINGNVNANFGSTDGWIVKLTKSYNLISGKLFVDNNLNGVLDGNDFELRNKSIVENVTGRRVYSKQNGDYFLPVIISGSFTAQPEFSIPYYNISPAFHNATFSTILETDSSNDFAFQPLGSVNDLKVTMTPLTPFRPGFDASYNLHYSNVGTTTIAPTLIFFNDQGTVYTSATTSPNSITPDSVIWNLPLLSPFSSGDIEVTVTLNTGLAIGSIVNSMVRIDPVAGDQTPPNNVFAWEVQVTGSFDPNDILVNLSSLTIPQVTAQTPLDYIIRFQNSGNDTAFNVNVKNILPFGVDPASFELINSSHNLQLEYIPAENLMWFRFNNILLPDSNTNEPGSHGYIHYRIIPEDNLNVGFTIENQADIFFDFNSPVITNIATTEIKLPTGMEEFSDAPFEIYPNPFSNELLVRFNSDKVNGKALVEFYTASGKLIFIRHLDTSNQSSESLEMPFRNLNSGVYFVKIMLDDKVFVKKLIKL